MEFLEEYKVKYWCEYPMGTRALATGGGYWERVELGWKWCTGATFPTPGGDCSGVVLIPFKSKETLITGETIYKI